MHGIFNMYLNVCESCTQNIFNDLQFDSDMNMDVDRLHAKAVTISDFHYAMIMAKRIYNNDVLNISTSPIPKCWDDV